MNYYIAGVWDLFHVGHLRALQRARQIAGQDKLIVAVVSDSHCKQYKKAYPVIPLNQRIEIVKSLNLADEVVIQEKQFDIEHMKSLNIDEVILGQNWQNKMPPHLQAMMKEVKVTFIPTTPDITTTMIKNRILKKPVIQMKRLGDYGRFGNQIFQYMFLRVYAKRNDFEVHVAPWEGTNLFGLQDLRPTRKLTYVKEKRVYRAEDSNVIGRKNVNIEGFFQYHTSYYAPDRKFIRQLFTPVYPLRTKYDEDIKAMKQEKPLIGVHIRMGDYGSERFNKNQYYITPFGWIESCLDRLSGRIFVASDDIEKAAKNFEGYDYCHWDKDEHFYKDFYTLTQCDYLLISQSTFSFAASMLGNASKYYRPDIRKGAFVEYDPWDSHTQIRPCTEETKSKMAV